MNNHQRFPNKLSKNTANAVFDLLLEYGAQEDSRGSFVGYLTDYNGYSHEFRFVGEFGGGGKLRYGSIGGLYATMYPESSTPVREQRLAELNQRLRQIEVK